MPQRVLVLVSWSLLVSTHSGASAISAQTYPIYQQNGFANPSPSQPHETTPYHQTYTTQNQSPQSNLYSSIMRQVLLNSFLSNPPTHTNLDPNLRNQGLNFDISQNNQIVPNLLNKYLSPSQYLNTNYENREEIEEKKTKETSKRNRKRSSNKKKKHESKDNTEISRIIKDSKDSHHTDMTIGSQITSRKKSRKHKTRNIDQENEQKVKEISNTRKTKKRKRKDNKQIEKQPNDDENNVQSTKTKKRRRHKKPKQDLDNTDKLNAEENVTLKEMKEGFNLAQSSGAKEENRVVRNPQIDSNETKPSSQIPEDVANTFLSKLPTFNNPIMSNFLTNYENFYQSLLNNMTVTDKRAQNIEIRKPKRNRNNNNNRRRKNQHNKNSTQEITLPYPKVKLKIDTVTTEKIVQVTEKIQTDIDSNNNTESLKSNDETKLDKESTTILPDEDLNSSNTQDLDENMNYPYNGYVDDYYPQFTDNVYNANNKENYVKILGDDKYYYATDEEIKRLNVGNSLPERKIKDFEMNKQYDDIEDETLHKIDDNDNEIDFKTPPLLENPDFETRPIKKSDIRPEVYYIKEDLIHRFVGDKSIETKPQHQRNFVKPPKDLETVYAKSKVVKYGSTHTRNSEETIPASDRSENFQDGGTTFVFAKSLNPEAYWSTK